MTHDNPYDQREADAAAEDRRQAMQDGAEEAMNECRQLGAPAYWWRDDCAESLNDGDDLAPDDDPAGY